MRVFDKMSKEEIKNIIKMREKEYVTSYVETSVYGQTETSGFS